MTRREGEQVRRNGFQWFFFRYMIGGVLYGTGSLLGAGRGRLGQWHQLGSGVCGVAR